MNFLIRLLLVPLAGMFILVARRAEQYCQSSAVQAQLAQASRYCTAPATAPAVAPAFVTASFIRFPQQVAMPVPAKQRPLPAASSPQAESLPTY